MPNQGRSYTPFPPSLEWAEALTFSLDPGGHIVRHVREQEEVREEMPHCMYPGCSDTGSHVRMTEAITRSDFSFLCDVHAPHCFICNSRVVDGDDACTGIQEEADMATRFLCASCRMANRGVIEECCDCSQIVSVGDYAFNDSVPVEDEDGHGTEERRCRQCEEGVTTTELRTMIRAENGMEWDGRQEGEDVEERATSTSRFQREAHLECPEVNLAEAVIFNSLPASPPERDSDEGGIRNYMYKPPPRFFHASIKDCDNLWLGVELEVQTQFPQRASKACTNAWAFCKSDASICGPGFELVTMPTTLKAHYLLWPKVLAAMSAFRATSHDPGTCGLHVHVPKKMLSSAERYKLGLMVYGNSELFRVLARRPADEWLHKYSNFTKITMNSKLLVNNSNVPKLGRQARMGRQTTSLAQRYGHVSSSPREAPLVAESEGMEDILLREAGIDRHEPRRCALNFLPKTTIEFRMFRGTLKTESLFASLELVHAVTNYVKEVSIATIAKTPGPTWSNKTFKGTRTNWNNFCDYIEGHRYKYLRPYMEGRGCWRV